MKARENIMGFMSSVLRFSLFCLLIASFSDQILGKPHNIHDKLHTKRSLQIQEGSLSVPTDTCINEDFL